MKESKDRAIREKILAELLKASKSKILLCRETEKKLGIKEDISYRRHGYPASNYYKKENLEAIKRNRKIADKFLSS